MGLLDIAKTAAKEVAKGATEVFSYIDTNQWAADMLAGAATAGGQYLLQKDNQDFQEKLLEKKKALSMVQYGGGGGKNANSLTDGLLTSGRPDLRDFTRGR